jgi:hypothetical protein
VLSLEHPEVVSFLESAGPGLWPLKDAFSKRRVLAIKANPDFILAAKSRNEIKFHFYWTEIGQSTTFGIITAAYDQPDAPCTIITVAYDDVMRSDLIELLDTDTLAIHFFDYQTAELFGGIWQLSQPPDFKKFLEDARKCSVKLTATSVPDYYQLLIQQYNDPTNDGTMLVAKLVESQVRDDVVVVQIKSEMVNGRGAAASGIVRSQLEIDKTPGDLNEQDIASLISTIYSSESVHLNPTLADGKEFCDVLAVGKNEIIAVQAKALQRTMRRLEEVKSKRESRIDKCFTSALAQVKGAERAFYKLERKIFSSGITIDIFPNKHLIFHIVVIPDKVPSLLEKWSSLIAKIDLTISPVLVVDMSEFANMANMYRDRELFVRTLFTLLEAYQKQNKIGTYSFYKDRVAITVQ